MTNWATIVEPREDEADTEEVLALVQAAGFSRPVVPAEAQTLGGAEIATNLDFSPKVTGLSFDPIDAAYVAEVEALLATWPVYNQQIRRLLTRVYPTITIFGRRTQGYGGAYGSRDQDVVNHFGHVYCTTDAPHVLAEGIVSSIGNWKLYAMGVRTRQWDSKLISNSTEQLVGTTTANAEPQPIGVALHSMYALHHILQWNVYVRAVGDVKWRTWADNSLRNGVPRLQRGWVSVQDTLQKTEDGGTFITGLRAWSDRLFAEIV
jgi:hypothetical protein